MLNLAALLFLYMSTPTPAVVQDGVDPVVARMAVGAREMIGRRTPGDMVITGVHAEGRTLILDVDLPPDVPEFLGPPQIAALTATHMCGSWGGSAFLSEGRVLRINAVRAGRALGSATIDRCPEAAGEGPAGAIASRLQAVVGVENGGVRLVSARREGNSLILTMDVVSGPTTGAEAAAQFVMGLCLAPDMQAAFFDQGWTLSLDTTVRGRDSVRTPITSCPAAQDGVDPVIAEIVRRAAAFPPDAGDVRRVGVRGEGRTLVWQLEIAPNSSGTLGPGDFAAVIANSICLGFGGTAFFTQGRTLRVEVRKAGASTSATVDRCAAPVGVGLSAAGFAGTMQPFVGREMDGVTITSVRADGETVIIVMDGVTGWRRRTPGEVLERDFLGNFCGRAAAESPFFDGSRGIRIDTLEGGRNPIRGRLIQSCPAR